MPFVDHLPGRGLLFAAIIGSYDFTSISNTFINDVVVTRDGAWFSDSRNAVLYHVPISPSGQLSSQFEALPLTGDLVVTHGVDNLNGIDATPNGKTLIAVQSNTGLLFTIDPDTGVTSEIVLAEGETVPNGDGILLQGKSLYVDQNRLNLRAKIDLASDLSSGEVISRTGNEEFDVPSTFDSSGRMLSFVNARFGITVTPDAEYWITGIRTPKQREWGGVLNAAHPQDSALLSGFSSTLTNGDACRRSHRSCSSESQTRRQGPGRER